jgi:fatty-acyl-CoA synthase
MLRTLADQVRLHARERGDREAFICEGRRTTFAAFDSATSRVANALIAAGVTDQARFAYLCRNSDRVFELVYGGHKAGAVPVGVNWRLATDEAAYILNDAGALLVFTDEESLPLALAAAAKAPCVRRIIALDGAGADRDVTDFVGWRDAFGDADPHRDGDTDAVACQIYTSGTTGNPKGALITHRNFIEQRRAGQDTGPWMNSVEGDVVLVAMPTYHIGGLTMGTIGFSQGCTVVVSARPDPASLMDSIEQHRVTITFLVPAAIQALLDHSDCRPERLRSLRILRYGAAPMTASLLRQIRAALACDIVQVYGMTEATGSVSSLPPQDHIDSEADRRMRSVGKSLAHLEITIRDADGNTLPTGAIGEICVRGRSIMAGYWRLPEATAEAFHGEWYRSGDAGALDEDGYLYLHDRIKDVIISGGENIYPAEVENAICDHPAVAEAAAIGVPDRRWGETVKVIVVVRSGSAVSEMELIEFVRGRIAAYKAPKSVAFVPGLPRNPSGKILRRELRASFRE